MQDKDQNNWKQLLENADGFQDEILKDKNEAWEKLYVRLHKKYRRKLLPWYWAAACLVALSIATFVLFGNKKHQPSVVISSPVNHVPAIMEKLLIREQQTNDASSQPASEKSIDISLKQKNTPNKKSDLISTHNPVIDSVNQQTVTETLIEPVLHFDSSAKEKITAVTAKKKLRIIHINDIGQPMEESTADNQFIQRDRFQLKILNSENYNPISTSPARNGLILFKSKNASN
jgi:hypothetical protein